MLFLVPRNHKMVKARNKLLLRGVYAHNFQYSDCRISFGRKTERRLRRERL